MTCSHVYRQTGVQIYTELSWVISLLAVGCLNLTTGYNFNSYLLPCFYL